MYLGFTLDCHLTMNAHVSNIARTCYFELRSLASICRFLTSTATATLVSAFVLSRIDYCENEKWKCVNFKCYSSEELITLNTLHEVVPTWYSFHSWVDWSNADKVSCSRRKHIDAGIEPATFESKVDILSPTPMVQ